MTTRAQAERKLSQYGVTLSAILAALPSSTTLDPAPLKPETLVQRLRETRTACREHKLITSDKFERYANDLVFTITSHGQVLACLRSNVPVEQARFARQDMQVPRLELVKHDPAILRAIALLQAAGAFKPKPIIVLGDVSSSLIEEVEREFDVVIVLDELSNENIIV